MRIEDLHRAGVQPVLRRTLPGFIQTEEIEADLVRRAERAFERVHGVASSHAMTGLSNGTDALILALEALGIGAGDGVIVPGLTWQATAGAVLDVNAIPVLIDVSPDTLCLDPDGVEAHLERGRAEGRPLPRAIIVVHLFNRAADMDRFVAIARRFGVFLLEDCAHAHGGAWRGRALGTFGVIGTFSTQRTKPLSGLRRLDDHRWESPTASEGGYAVTGVPILDRRLRSLASCGREVAVSQIDPAEVDELTAYWRERVAALNLPASPLQSGNNRLPGSVAERHLDHLERFLAEHRERAAGMAEIEAALAGMEGITLLPPQPGLTRPVAHMFPFRFDPEAFGGMDSELFRQVLRGLLDGYLVDIPYHPLGGGPAGYRSPVYNPQSKPRYHVSDQHWQEIDPAQWSLPVAHDAYRQVVVLENTALREPGIAPALAQALTWMRDNASRLVTAATS